LGISVEDGEEAAEPKPRAYCDVCVCCQVFVLMEKGNIRKDDQ
jgi:hypothetical protein